MNNKILEKIIEPSKIKVGNKFKIKIKIDLIPSYNVVTELNNNLITENGDNIVTEGDFYYE